MFHGDSEGWPCVPALTLGEVGTGVLSPNHVFISEDPLAATLWPQFNSHLCVNDSLNK